jgi:uncharacterized protein
MGKTTKRVATTLILIYQYSISPLLLPSCRFTPSCSEYIRQAIERYGLLLGIRLGALRLLRCHPFHPGGYDPPLIPDRGSSVTSRWSFGSWLNLK